MIRIQDVNLIYGRHTERETQALKHINLDIQDNEIIAIVGASGCGKSTLLRLIAGLLMPSSGTVSIDDEIVAHPRQDTGIVFQAPTLVPWANILDNTRLPSSIMGCLDDQARSRATRLLTTAGLGNFLHHHPKQLSGGMQQRVAICRALVHNPKVVLMDEPFGALDALTRETMTLELLRLWYEDPKTIVFVTHSISEAVMLGHRIVVMSPRPGQITEILDVNLPRERDFSLVGTPEFTRCAAAVRELIFQHEVA